MTFEEELLLLIKTKSPFIYIVSSEEERVEYAIRKLMIASINRFVYTWDFVNGFNPMIGSEGFRRNPFEALTRIRTVFPSLPALFIFKDYSTFFSDLSISRELRNLIPTLRSQPKTIIFINDEKQVPIDIIDKFVFLELSLPTVSEIEKELSRLLQTLGQPIEQNHFDLLVNSCQ